MLQKLGIENVQSRFRSEMVQTANTVDADPLIKRSASTVKPKKVNSIRDRLTEVKEIDEQVNDDAKKVRNNANENIRKKQENYLKSLADKKKQEIEKEEEERKRQEYLKQNLRAKVKGMLDNVERKPREQNNNEEEEEDKEQRKMNPDDIQSFLERNTQKKKVFTNITDFDMWKKKHRVDKNTKVYICTGGYGTIKKALETRGWIENKDSKSP